VLRRRPRRRVDLWYEASLIAQPFLGEGFPAAEREEIAMRWLTTADTIVDEVDGRMTRFLTMLGTSTMRTSSGPGHPRREIGRALMDWARAARSFLELDVFEANASGRRFDAADGFLQVGHHVRPPTRPTEPTRPTCRPDRRRPDFTIGGPRGQARVEEEP
jgi:hypothetical protein